MTTRNTVSNKPCTSNKGIPKKILLTRPKESNDLLAELLRQQGYDVRILPLLAIQRCPETPQTKETVINIDHYQHVICSSKHAAAILANYIDHYWPQMPLAIHWYALGKASACPLQKLSLDVTVPVNGNTSEDLLALASLSHVAGQKILLAKGRGGRTELQQTLSQRGAGVHLLELYQRVPISYPDSVVQDLLLDWQPDFVVLLSGETMEQFWRLSNKLAYPDQQAMAHAPLPRRAPVVIVPSQRLASVAENLHYPALTVSSAEPEKILWVINRSLGD